MTAMTTMSEGEGKVAGGLREFFAGRLARELPRKLVIPGNPALVAWISALGFIGRHKSAAATTGYSSVNPGSGITFPWPVRYSSV